MRLSNAIAQPDAPDLVRDFLVLAEELHFHRTAARLGMSQSGLSQRIARLECRLGVRLFSRTTRVVRLTEHGERLWARARIEGPEALVASYALRREAAHRSETGLRVGIVPLADVEVLHRLCTAFSRALSIRVVAPGQALDELERARIDVAVAWLPPQLPSRGALVLRSEAVVALLDESDALANEHTIAPELLLTRRVVAIGGIVGGREPLASVSVELCPTMDDLFTRIVTQGDVALVPGSAVEYRPRRVVSRPVIGVPRLSLAALCRRGLPASVRQTIQDAFQPTSRAMLSPRVRVA